MKKLFLLFLLGTAPLLASEEKNLEISKEKKTKINTQNTLNKKEIKFVTKTMIDLCKNCDYPKNNEDAKINTNNFTLFHDKINGYFLKYTGDSAIDTFLGAFKKLPEITGTIECKVAADIVQKLLLFEKLGDAAFKKHILDIKTLFSQKNSFNTIGLSYISFSNAFLKVIREKEHKGKATAFYEITETPTVGASCSIKNIKDYFTYRDGGSWQGFNVFYVGKNKLDEDLYIGFVEECQNGPITLSQIYTLFYNDLKQSEKFREDYKNKEAFVEALEKERENAPFKYIYINDEKIKKYKEKAGKNKKN